jgi:hypothetical protein
LNEEEIERDEALLFHGQLSIAKMDLAKLSAP